MFFENLEGWRTEWKEMPEFVQGDFPPFQSVIVHFENEDDRNHFAKLIGQNITKKTKFIYFPKLIKANLLKKRCISKHPLNPKYPVYIISKGRWKSRLTSKALEKINVPYHIVVEPQEYDNYANVIESEKILKLPFSNLGQGSIPARNWVWEHAVKIGAKRHWILDDNIHEFYRLAKNIKWRVDSGTIFRVIEKFVNRYKNIALAGMQYELFVPRKRRCPPFTLNTRIYSCILIKNDIPYRWRGQYNEDTDLCIRVLKDGWCTVLFYAFLADKTATMTMKGGNTEDLYKIKNGRLKMAQSLAEQHSDIVHVTKKWGRYQHHVDYSKFRNNKLIKKSGRSFSDSINNYGMELITDEENNQ